MIDDVWADILIVIGMQISRAIRLATIPKVRTHDVCFLNDDDGGYCSKKCV